MSEHNDQPLQLAVNATREEIEALVAGIDRSLITDLVKHSSGLQRYVFPGFRPSKLPWSQVPARLAREVEDNPARFEDFVRMWIASNEALLEDVADISTEQLHEDLAELLARHGPENRLQVLWALRFDGRETIREALEAGLAEEICDETSRLLSQAERHTLTLALETARSRVAYLQDRFTEAETILKEANRLLQRKNEQLETAQEEIERLRSERKQLTTQTEEQAGRLEALAAEQDQAQEKLEEEQAKTEELRRSVRDLKETLRAQIEGSRQEETQQELNQALLRLEEERKEAAELRLSLRKLEQQIEAAYAKRDREQARSAALEQQVDELQYDKEVIIEEKRQLAERLDRQGSELRSIRRRLQDRAAREALTQLPWEEMDRQWLEEREAVRDYLHGLVSFLQGQGEASTSPVDKWGMWDRWLEYETSLLQDVIPALDHANEESALMLRRAQQLLTLRWYLLEYTRQAVLSAIQTESFAS
jgi:hypothetical protein